MRRRPRRVDGSGRNIHRQNRGHAGLRVGVRTEGGENRRAHGRVKSRLRRRHHRRPRVLGEVLGYQRNAGATADGDHRRDISPATPGALQRICERSE